MCLAVALRKESVDRNYIIKITVLPPRVALRKESVDRNKAYITIITTCTVALRKESVDRNNGRLGAIHNTEMSLSARRAWIEIVRALAP